jgi:hypothetical protein
MEHYICLMKYRFTLLYLLMMIAVGAGAQTLTGIWKGYFVQESVFGMEDRYKFEVQIEQLPNNAINGVTYSYKTTVFYGKAELKGIFTKKTKNIVFNETKLVDVKIANMSQPCLMTCYLEYDKMGTLETLTGTYASRNLRDGGDCGSGRVYLEKTSVTDFYKEDFLKKDAEKKKGELGKKDVPNKPVIPQTKITPKVSTPKVNGIKPGAEDNVITKTDKSGPDTKTPQVAPSEKPDEVAKVPVPKIKPLPTPDVIKQRKNEVAKTITTSAKEIKIDLYDNGEIDGDTITVYHNNQLIVSRKMLTNKAISFTLKIDESSPSHEFVMVAENLGSIPPNTALMVITAGSKRYELFLTSTEQKNAVVVVQYKADSND